MKFVGNLFHIISERRFHIELELICHQITKITKLKKITESELKMISSCILAEKEKLLKLFTYCFSQVASKCIVIGGGGGCGREEFCPSLLKEYTTCPCFIGAGLWHVLPCGVAWGR